jgi:peptide-methionine (R)-S-oxide reductase
MTMSDMQDPSPERRRTSRPLARGAANAAISIDRRAFGLSSLALLTLASIASRARAERSGSTKAFEVQRSPDEWRKLLTREQFYVLREHGTERAFSSPLDKLYEPGRYDCAGCELPLFSSETKYDSKTGWPSFWKPLDNAVGTKTDISFFMARTEVHCRRCGGHLGHVFEDGPKPTGLRYCMNGVSLRFVPAPKS